MPLIKCAYCEKEFRVKPFRIKQTKGKEICCSKSCLKKLSFTEVSCLNCGKHFLVHRSRLKYGHGKFCSWKCRFEWASLNKSGANSPSWRGGPEERICETCGIHFMVSRARINTRNDRFCSYACRARGKEHQERLKKLNQSGLYLKAWRSQQKRPNKPETKLKEILDKFFPNEWKYVGDGSLIINGLNPDFVNCNGRKLLIEVFGDYWHGRVPNIDWHRTELGRMMVYAAFGFKCLVIWEKDIKKLSEDDIALKVKQLMKGRKLNAR